MKKFIAEYFNKLNININDEQCNQFVIYKDLLVEWNKVMNLTGITEDKEVCIKHFADSVTILNSVDI